MRVLFATAALNAFAFATSLEAEAQTKPYRSRSDTLLVYVEEDEPLHKYRSPDYRQFDSFTITPV